MGLLFLQHAQFGEVDEVKQANTNAGVHQVETVNEGLDGYISKHCLAPDHYTQNQEDNELKAEHDYTEVHGVFQCCLIFEVCCQEQHYSEEGPADEVYSTLAFDITRGAAGETSIIGSYGTFPLQSTFCKVLIVVSHYFE